jgi:hypothetical protein
MIASELGHYIVVSVLIEKHAKIDLLNQVRAIYMHMA